MEEYFPINSKKHSTVDGEILLEYPVLEEKILKKKYIFFVPVTTDHLKDLYIQPQRPLKVAVKPTQLETMILFVDASFTLKVSCFSCKQTAECDLTLGKPPF